MIRVILLTFLFSMNAHAGNWADVNKALMQEDWGLADIHLDELGQQRISQQERFNVMLNQAWVKYKLGLSGEAKILLSRISRLEYSPDELETLNLQDTLLTVKYDHIETLPPADNRVIVDAADELSSRSDYIYSALSAATWTKRKVNEYLTVNSETTPFLKPIAPKLVRGEFEKPSDFIIRVEQAQNEYKQAMEKFYDSQRRNREKIEQIIDQRKAYLPTIARLYTQVAIKKTMGKPNFYLNAYNATTEYFPGRIASSKDTDLFSGVNVAIDEPIETAPNLKSLLRQAEPILVFSFSMQEIKLTNVLLELPNKRIIEARLIDKAIDQQLASYQVPEIAIDGSDEYVQTAPGSVVEGKTEVLLKSLDPEIMRLKTELSKAESMNNQAVIARLKHDIKQFESTLQSSFNDDLETLLKKASHSREKLNYHAVIIGINQYQKTINVEYADRSAKLFSKVINKVLGVPNENITLLLDEEATSGSIKTRLRYIGNNLKKGERLFFFYAGHGIPAQNLGGAPFILAHDMDTGFASHDEDMKLSTIWSNLTSSGQGEVIAFLDSCFSGNSDNRWVYEGTAPGLLVREPISPLSNDQLMIFTAGNETQFANYYPEKGHRLFSYYLMKGLLSGKTSTEELFQFVRSNVAKVSSKRGPDYQQIPQKKGKNIETF